MTPAQITTARLLVSSPCFRRMPGVLMCTPDGTNMRISSIDADGCAWVHGRHLEPCDFEGCYPDLDDAATRGCLYALVCDRHGPDTCVVRCRTMAGNWRWFVRQWSVLYAMYRDIPDAVADNYGEALALALLEAP